MKFRRLIELIHLWLGLILGAQVVLWMASGVIMTFFDLPLVRGELNAAVKIPIEFEARNYSSPGGVIAQTPGANELKLKHFLGRPAWEARGADGVALFDAQTGEKLSPLSEDLARAVAREDFVGDGKVETVELLADPPIEFRRPGPVWRVSLTDKLETRLYISPDTGEVVARRNKIWRLYDFFWMLHTMDYKGRDDFNNPLVKTASATALLFSLSGVVLLWTSFRRGRFGLNRRKASVSGGTASAESKSPPAAGSSEFGAPER